MDISGPYECEPDRKRRPVRPRRCTTRPGRERLSGHRSQGPIWTSVRGAGVKGVSPAERGRSVAEPLDAGEHTLTLLAATMPAVLDGAGGVPYTEQSWPMGRGRRRSKTVAAVEVDQ